MNVKKFAQDKAKKLKYDKFIKENKQNLCSIDDSKFKQFSVDLHRLSLDQQTSKKKNIIKEDISVFLQNQSTSLNKSYNDRVNLEREMIFLTEKIEQSSEKLEEILLNQLENEDQIKNEQIRRLMQVLYQKLHSERQSYRSGCDENLDPKVTSHNKKVPSKIQLPEQMMVLQSQQLQSMEEELKGLKSSKCELELVRTVDKQQKGLIRQKLEGIYQQQIEQVKALKF